MFVNVGYRLHKCMHKTRPTFYLASSWHENWHAFFVQLGKIEEDTHYVVIDLPETLKLEGDIKLCFYSRKYDNSGIFEPIFSFWFNCGFIDHTPVVWDMNCFDNVPPKLKKVPISHFSAHYLSVCILSHANHFYIIHVCVQTIHRNFPSTFTYKLCS
jgi:hypothetical protein